MHPCGPITANSVAITNDCRNLSGITLFFLCFDSAGSRLMLIKLFLFLVISVYFSYSIDIPHLNLSPTSLGFEPLTNFLDFFVFEVYDFFTCSTHKIMDITYFLTGRLLTLEDQDFIGSTG